MSKTPKNMCKTPETLYCLPADVAACKESVPVDCRVEFVVGNRTEIPADYTTRFRTLPFHFICVTELEGTEEVCKKVCFPDGREIPVRPGECVFLPAGVTHCVAELGTQRRRVSWMHFFSYVTGDLDLLTFFEIPTLIPAAQTGRIPSLLNRLIALPRRLNLTDSIVQQLTGEALLLELIRRGRVRERARSRDQERLTAVFDLLRGHDGEPFSNRELAAKANLSLSRFLELFGRASGTSPKRFQERLRFQKACRMLCRSELTVAEIAQELGFCDAYHFSRRFKAETGLPPGEYRRNFSGAPASADDAALQ